MNINTWIHHKVDIKAKQFCQSREHTIKCAKPHKECSDNDAFSLKGRPDIEMRKDMLR